jgi:hypothetical protein
MPKKHEIEKMQELLRKELYVKEESTLAALDKLCTLAYKGYGDLAERLYTLMSDAPEYEHTAEMCALIATTCDAEQQEGHNTANHLLKRAAIHLRRARIAFLALQRLGDKGEL